MPNAKDGTISFATILQDKSHKLGWDANTKCAVLLQFLADNSTPKLLSAFSLFIEEAANGSQFNLPGPAYHGSAAAAAEAFLSAYAGEEDEFTPDDSEEEEDDDDAEFDDEDEEFEDEDEDDEFEDDDDDDDDDEEFEADDDDDYAGEPWDDEDEELGEVEDADD